MIQPAMIQPPDPTKLQTNTATFFDTDSNDPQRSSFDSINPVTDDSNEEGVKLLSTHTVLGFPYLTVSWCYLGNKHVYHLFGVDPFYWLLLFSIGALYSNVLLTCLIFIFWICVILYTFQETPILGADDDTESDSDDSDYEEMYRTSDGMNVGKHGTTSSIDSSNATGTRSSKGIRRRYLTSQVEIDPDDELQGIFGK